MSVFSKLCTDIVDFGTHNSNARTEKITKITIHHMACVASGADCARAHYRKNSASANYYIGTNGDICGGVSEDRRAWTSGSSWNDQRAITFEVSNSEAKEPWPVSDAAYRSAIRLAADICKRYGITPHYTGDKNGTLTLHCMYQATQCPGTTWKQRHASGKVERDILEAMAITPPAPQPEPVSDEEKIWNYLSARIHNDYGVAGLMGNLYAESTLHSNNLQNTFEKRLGMTDAEYTAAVDDGSLDMQLDFLWWELSTGYKGTLQALQTATSVYGASTAVLTQFERPSDQSEAMKQKRASYGQVYFDRYSQSGAFRPYIARIMADELNVRKGPGINYAIVQTVRKGEAFTIVQESGEWGKLKSGVGWICLTYTMKVRLV